MKIQEWYDNFMSNWISGQDIQSMHCIWIKHILYMNWVLNEWNINSIGIEDEKAK